MRTKLGSDLTDCALKERCLYKQIDTELSWDILIQVRTGIRDWDRRSLKTLGQGDADDPERTYYYRKVGSLHVPAPCSTARMLTFRRLPQVINKT